MRRLYGVLGVLGVLALAGCGSDEPTLESMQEELSAPDVAEQFVDGCIAEGGGRDVCGCMFDVLERELTDEQWLAIAQEASSGGDDGSVVPADVLEEMALACSPAQQ